MRTTRVKKDDLQEIVLRNRDKHRSTYEQAFAAYREVARDRLERALAALGSGETPPLHFGLVIPEDHTDDYSTVLEMLAMETRDEIELSWDEFRNYVQDEWGWSARFNETTTSYLGR